MRCSVVAELSSDDPTMPSPDWLLVTVLCWTHTADLVAEILLCSYLATLADIFLVDQ